MHSILYSMSNFVVYTAEMIFGDAQIDPDYLFYIRMYIVRLCLGGITSR